MRAAGLLLDYGGVLTTSERASCRTFCLATGVPPDRLLDLVRRAYDGSEPDGTIARAERGEIPGSELDRWLADSLSAGLPKPLHPNGLKARLFATVRPHRRMLDAVARLRAAGVRTALVSNSWGGDGSGHYEQDALGGLVDAVVVSGREGVRKPERAIYLLAAERLGLAPERCVFVDDLPECAAGAEAVGIRAILHRSAGRTTAELASALGTGPIDPFRRGVPLGAAP